MQKRANQIGWRIVARLDARWALNGAKTGAGSLGGAGGLAKRGRAEGMMPEAGPRVAEAGWHQPAEIGPAGQRHNVEVGRGLPTSAPHERHGKIFRSGDNTGGA